MWGALTAYSERFHHAYDWPAPSSGSPASNQSSRGKPLAKKSASVFVRVGVPGAQAQTSD
jgi:hypothetical protein